MKLRTHFLMAGLAFSLGVSHLAMAADDPTAGAKVDETKNHDRGVMWVPMGSPGNGTAPVNVPVISSPATTKAIQAVTHPTAPAKSVKKAPTSKHIVHIKTKNIPAIAKSKVKPASALARVDSKPSNESKQEYSQTALVKFTQDGPVVSATLDHSATGGSPKYKVGDKMVINVKAHQDCNVVVFNYDSTGTLTQIFPNDYQQNGFVRSGDNIEIGGTDSPFDYQIAGKGGSEKIFVYAYPTGVEKPQPLQTVAMNPIAGTPFRGGEMTVDQYRKMVNECQSFTTREVKVTPKRVSQLISQSSNANSGSPNKIELSFTVEK